MSFSVIGTGDVVVSSSLKRPPHKGSIYDHISNADTCFANLESPFSKSTHAAEKLIAIKSNPMYASIMTDIGIDVVTVANNHGMDYGLEGLRETTEALDSVGIAHVGSGEDTGKSLAAVVKDVNNAKVAYIGITTTLPNGSRAGPRRPGLAGVRVFTKYVIDTVTIDESPGMSPFVETTTYKEDEDLLLQAIRDAKGRADFVLVSIHWGVPYGWVAFTQDEIAQYQQPLAHAIIDAGASAIFGHHPHVVQGVEYYKGAPVFYSLGNFIFSNTIVEPQSVGRQYPAYAFSTLQQTLSNIGALAKLSWVEGKLSSCSIIPVTVVVEDGEPIEATLKDAQVLLSRLTTLSKNRGAMFEMKRSANGFEIVITQA